jgi:acyl-CoA thioester hydrolase
MLFFASRGFSAARFQELRFGPVILRDELEYFRELKLLEPFVVDMGLVGLSADASRFRIRNVFRREDGTAVARVTSAGLWLDLDRRKPRPPPEGLAAAFAAIQRTDDFAEIRRDPDR